MNPMDHIPGRPAQDTRRDASCPLLKGMDSSLPAIPEAPVVPAPEAPQPWLTEFGKGYACPDLPSGFEDVSWHNDSAPAYAILGEVGGEVDAEVVRLWMEHPDPKEREFSTEDYVAPRFMVSEGDVYGSPQDVIGRYEGDDFAEALRIARSVHEVHVLGTLAQSFRMADALWHPEAYRQTPGLIPYASEEEATAEVEACCARLLEICPNLDLGIIDRDGSRISAAGLAVVTHHLAQEKWAALPVVRR